MKDRIYLMPMAAMGLGGVLAKHALDEWVVRSFLAADAFDLADVYHAGGTIAIIGGLAFALTLALGSHDRLQKTVRKDAIALLASQCGREDLPEGYRAAIAYVVQDLQENLL